MLKVIAKRLWIAEKNGRPVAQIMAYNAKQARELYDNPLLDVKMENITKDGIIGDVPPRVYHFVRIRPATPEESNGV